MEKPGEPRVRRSNRKRTEPTIQTLSHMYSSVIAASNGQFRRLEDVDDELTLPLTERYFLGGLGQFQLRGFKARSVGPRRAILRPISRCRRSASAARPRQASSCSRGCTAATFGTRITC